MTITFPDFRSLKTQVDEFLFIRHTVKAVDEWRLSFEAEIDSATKHALETEANVSLTLLSLYAAKHGIDIEDFAHLRGDKRIGVNDFDREPLLMEGFTHRVLTRARKDLVYRSFALPGALTFLEIALGRHPSPMAPIEENRWLTVAAAIVAIEANETDWTSVPFTDSSDVPEGPDRKDGWGESSPWFAAFQDATVAYPFLEHAKVLDGSRELNNDLVRELEFVTSQT